MGTTLEQLKEWANPVIQTKAKLAQNSIKIFSAKKQKSTGENTGWGAYLGSFIYASDQQESDEIRRESVKALSLF